MSKIVDCSHCSVYKYCGTMVASTKLCRSIHKTEDHEDKQNQEH